MNNSQKDREKQLGKTEDLTILERKQDWYLEDMEEVPITRVDIHTLSKPERRYRERQIAKAWKRKHRKPYTRKPGTVHPGKKKATRRRLMRNRWATNPFGCVIHGYGTHAVDKEKWDRLIQPLWDKYDPTDLTVVKYRDCGTKVKPYTVYTLDVYHKEHGLLYCGNSQLIYDLSSL